MLDRVRSWGVTSTPFRSLDELLRLAGFKVARTPAETDEVLRRLVVLAATEPLAARIVLQRLLPGLLAIVRREQQRDRGVDAFDLARRRGVVGDRVVPRRPPPHRRRRQTAQRRPPPGVHDAAAQAGAIP